MVIDFNPHDENADTSTRINVELFLNRIDSSDMQSAKHDAQRISTDDRMMIDFNPHS
jgi:hypothetical protein